MNKSTKSILNGNLAKCLWLLAVPIMIMNFFNAVYALIDAYFVSQIGVTEVAAITFVTPINQLISSIGMGLSIAGTSLIAREVGRQDKESEDQYAIHLLVISLILGVIISIFCFILSRQLLEMNGMTESLMTVSDQYFKYTTLSAPLLFFNSAYVGIRRAQGDSVQPLILNTFSLVVKVVLNYYFIEILKMGIISLALSTFIANAIMVIYGGYILFIKKTLQRIEIQHFKFQWSKLWLIVKIGIPSVLERSATSYGFLILNKQVLLFGEEVLAGYGITNRINSMAFASVTGIGTALATIVSQNLGAKNYRRVEKSIRIAHIFSLLTAMLTMSIIWVFRLQIAKTFSSGDSLVVQHTMNAMSVYSFSIIPWGVFQVVIGAFQGTGHTKYNLVLSLVRLYLFRVPLVWAMVNYTPQIEEYSVWYAMLLSNIFTAIAALIIWWRKKKRVLQ